MEGSRSPEKELEDLLTDLLALRVTNWDVLSQHCSAIAAASEFQIPSGFGMGNCALWILEILPGTIFLPVPLQFWCLRLPCFDLDLFSSHFYFSLMCCKAVVLKLLFKVTFKDIAGPLNISLNAWLLNNTRTKVDKDKCFKTEELPSIFSSDQFTKGQGIADEAGMGLICRIYPVINNNFPDI